MGRFGEGAEVAAVTSPVDLDVRVVYFPVRHHSPACAWHVNRLVRELRPAAVLIEGPRDATPLIPLLVHPATRMPVAIYTTYVRRPAEGLPDRHAAYYPLCDFSPELAAIRAGLDIGATVRFIDLTFSEMVEAQVEGQTVKGPEPRGTRSLQEEAWLAHSRLLREACAQTGTRDPDDLWDHLYETDFRHLPTGQFMENVLAYCALARGDQAEAALSAEGCLAREQAMAAAVAESAGTTLVVTGGFHSVALPHSTPALPKPLKIPPDDRQVVLMRYSFEQLDRLNGYASGMPSPEFYQRVWDQRETTEILIEVARECRQKNLGTSTADAVFAAAHTRRLAHFRGHAEASREDLLDGARSVFIKGAIDAEGTPVLAIARKLLAGNRVGDVPAEAGLPPIVHDFRQVATELRLKLDSIDDTEAVLDLYRKSAHRQISRLFHRLSFLAVPFASFVRGPDFVAGQRLERIQEVWRYHWSPQTESALIERSLYGSTVEEAATGRLLEAFQEAEGQGQGRNAALATRLVLHACRMGMHRSASDLLRRVAGLLAEDSSFVSLVEALENLLALEVSREPLEAHHLTGLQDLAATAYRRACFVIPSLSTTPAEEEAAALDSLNALLQAAGSLGDNSDFQQLRTDALAALVATTGGSAALRGGAVGVLYGEGKLIEEELVRHLRGHLLSSRDDGADGPNFLRGLVKTARSVLWQAPQVLAGVSEVLQSWDEDRFIKLLPGLRLALAELTPRETDVVAKQVAALLGAESLRVNRVAEMSSSDMMQALAINRSLRALLVEDGLEAFCE